MENNNNIDNFVRANLGIEAIETAKILTKMLMGAVTASKKGDYDLTESDILHALSILNDVLETSK